MPTAEWTFEPDPLPQEIRGREAGPFKPATGAGALSGSHKSEDSKWSSPAGNGSKSSLSADTWSSGDFFVLKVSTANRRNIVLSWDQTRSDYAPPTFALSYRLPGEPAKELVSYEVPVVRWSMSQPSENSSFVADLTGCKEISDREEIEFLIMPKSQSKSPNGTTRIDNVRVWGVPHVAQESEP